MSTEDCSRILRCNTEPRSESEKRVYMSVFSDVKSKVHYYLWLFVVEGNRGPQLLGVMSMDPLKLDWDGSRMSVS